MIRLVKEFSPDQVEWRNDPGVRRFTRQNGIIPKEDHEKWVQGIKHDPTCTYFGIESYENQVVKGFLRKPKIVGYVGFSNMMVSPMRNHGTAEYSILIGPEYHGEGYGTQAMELLLNYGFRVIGLHRIYGEILATNIGGLSIAQKLGFKEEGVLRESYFKDGKRVNSIIVGLLKKDYELRMGFETANMTITSKSGKA